MGARMQRLIVRFKEPFAFSVSVNSEDFCGNLGVSNRELHINHHRDRFFEFEPQCFHDADSHRRLSVKNDPSVLPPAGHVAYPDPRVFGCLFDQ